MSVRRFEIRPIASRRLRAALLLVFVLALIGVSQTSLATTERTVALLALGAIFVDGWRRTRMPSCTLKFDYRPLSCRVVDAAGSDVALRCRRASVYPWLIVLHFATDETDSGHVPIGLSRAVVLLPDSLVKATSQDWRRLLVWARLARQQQAGH